MKSNHISILKAFLTVIRVILAGENPSIAFVTCFRMRRITNKLYDLGISPEEILDALSSTESLS